MGFGTVMRNLMIDGSLEVEKVMPDIIIAAYAGDAVLVQRLLSEGSDVNSVDPADNLTCLHIACMNCNHQLAGVILDWHDTNGDVNFSVKSLYRPRLAWQMAMNSHDYDLGRRVEAATRASARLHTAGTPSDPAI